MADGDNYYRSTTLMPGITIFSPFIILSLLLKLSTAPVTVADRGPQHN